MTRVLTKKDKEEILSKYKQGVKIHTIKKEYDTTWFTVSKIIEAAGLELPKSNSWTKKELEQLKDLSEEYHYKDIALMLNRPEQGIYLKARRSNITLIMNRRKWTPEEEEYLEASWGSLSIGEIASNLKRTDFSIKVKAVRMGLGPMLESSDKLSISEVSEILNVTRDRIMNTWVKKGLIVDKETLGREKAYYLVSYNNLISVLQNNPYEWDSRTVEKGLLGPETVWIEIKRRWDEENNPLFYRRWTDEELLIAIKMIEENYSYKEIAKEINRSDKAVAYMLRSLGYNLKKWNKTETAFLIENYKELTYKQIAEILNKSLDSVEYNATKNKLKKKNK